MPITPDRLITFDSVHQAIKAEKLLLGAGITAKAAPTPREIDISCGQCLWFASTEEAAVFAILQQVRWSKAFRCNTAQRRYEKLADYGGSL